MGLAERVQQFITRVDDIEVNQKAKIKSKKILEDNLQEIYDQNIVLREELDIARNAITILREVSDESVQISYKFIEESVNASLERIFNRTKRKIELKEYTRAGQYPQLDVVLHVENNKIRSLKMDSGHGLGQIVSLLCVLTLITISGGRRLLILDETLSGLSENSRRIVDDILWTFTEIGFQFIISEHGFVPKGAKVYQLKLEGGITFVEMEYVADKGCYIGQQLEDNPEYMGEIMGEIKNGAVIAI